MHPSYIAIEHLTSFQVVIWHKLIVRVHLLHSNYFLALMIILSNDKNRVIQNETSLYVHNHNNLKQCR